MNPNQTETHSSFPILLKFIFRFFTLSEFSHFLPFKRMKNTSTEKKKSEKKKSVKIEEKISLEKF